MTYIGLRRRGLRGSSAKNGLSLGCNCCTRDSRYARDKLTNVRRAGISRDSGDSPHSPGEGLPSLLSPAVAASPPSLPSPRPTTQPAQASMLPFALHDIPPGVPPRCTPLSLPDTARCLLPELTTTRHGKKPKSRARHDTVNLPSCYLCQALRTFVMALTRVVSRVVQSFFSLTVTDSRSDTFIISRSHLVALRRELYLT